MPRPQFTLRALLVVTLVVAAIVARYASNRRAEISRATEELSRLKHRLADYRRIEDGPPKARTIREAKAEIQASERRLKELRGY